MGVPIGPDDITALSLDERVDLALQLLGSVATEHDRFELTDEWKAELARRSAEHDRSPGAAIPWELVVAEARARAGR